MSATGAGAPPALRPGRRPPPVPGDYAHLETVVAVGFPVREARTWLNRRMGNPVGVRLVEAGRGEAVGCVRGVEVHPVEGGDPIRIEAVHLHADGTVAEPFETEGVERRGVLLTPDGRPPRGLDPRDRVVLVVPVRSYLRFLPAVFRGSGPTARPQRPPPAPTTQATEGEWMVQRQEAPAPEEGEGDALQRFLLLFQHLMTTVVDQVESLSDLTNPLTADPRFLPWIASWVGFTLDESLPLHQQRELVRRAIRLYRTRGTVAGVEEIVRVLTSAPVRILPRRPPNPFVLGGSTLAGGTTVARRYLRGEPPGHHLRDVERPDALFFALSLEPRERFAARFSERAAQVLTRIAQIVTAEKPAHLTFTLLFEDDPA